jgi:predicted CXXCH cytochrome family protein
MTLQYKTLVLSVIVACLMVCALSQAEDNSQKFKLKPGASGKLCLQCHGTFQDTLNKPFVHTPLKKGECTGCHNPHASNHGKMLTAENVSVCLTCHASVIPKEVSSSHKVVVEGNCMKCHDPHASSNKFNLVKAGNLLCADCHKAMVDNIGKVKFKHKPVVEGCGNCHLPHTSAKAPFLLKNDIVQLCTGCHRTDRPIFAKQHMNYPVAGARCTSCHDPHGSDRPGILYNNVHKPITNRMCNQCHEEANSKTPLKLKKEGNEICRACHSTMINQMAERNRIHWPVLSKEGCLSCHNPHASTQKGLLKAPMLTLCGRCHDDTIKRQEKSVTKHEPVKEGVCTSCHEPHASNNTLLFKQATIIDVCAACHDWQKHSTHPIGEKIKDKRNKNLTVQCLSCHRSNRTEFKGMIPFQATSELCIQCHAEFKR